jgi:hypothetical protein
MKPLVISNYDPDIDTVIYSNDVGSWNVSRALRDCRAGKHKRWLLDIEECYRANEGVEVDEAKIVAFAEVKANGGTFEPGLGIVENGKVWFIDGHHRMRASHRLGEKDFGCWIIEEADAKPYQIFYNGKRKPPFKPY